MITEGNTKSLTKVNSKNSLRPNKPPPPPRPPLNSMLLSQGSWFGICSKCDSSLKFRLLFWKKSLGCIQPLCSNYWKLKV